MAKLITKDLGIKNKIADFDVKVRDGITVVGGDSSTGKSLFFKEKKLHSQRFNDTDYVFINYTNMQDFMKIFTEGLTDKIVFVDNADLIVPMNIDVYRAIQSSQNQFVFFGRDITRYDKNYDNWAELKEEKKGKFKLRFVLKRAGEIWQ